MYRITYLFINFMLIPYALYCAYPGRTEAYRLDLEGAFTARYCGIVECFAAEHLDEGLPHSAQVTYHGISACRLNRNNLPRMRMTCSYSSLLVFATVGRYSHET